MGDQDQIADRSGGETRAAIFSGVNEEEYEGLSSQTLNVITNLKVMKFTPQNSDSTVESLFKPVEKSRFALTQETDTTETETEEIESPTSERRSFEPEEKKVEMVEPFFRESETFPRLLLYGFTPEDVRAARNVLMRKMCKLPMARSVKIREIHNRTDESKVHPMLRIVALQSRKQ